MELSKKTPSLKAISKFFSDESLTKKATLNAIASVLDYFARFAVAFAVTPITVSVLGDYLYGTWQVLTRFITFISPTSGRPSTVLRYTIANHQTTSDDNEKRRYVGSALFVWLIFLPLVLVTGSVFAWIIPLWIKTPPEYFWRVRLTAAILVIDLAVTGIEAIPRAVMQGQNMSYKRMGLTTTLTLLTGGFTWAALALGSGIVGVACATILSSLISFLLYINIMKRNTPWFGIARPDKRDIGSYMNLSWWFISWDIVFKLMMSIDVIVIGLLSSVESVTNYTLTKHVPEMMITMIAIIVFGVAPGLGGIIGAKDYEKAARIRGEIMAVAWLIVTSLSITMMIWNRVFMTLWVGPDQYTGTFTMLLILLVTIQFVMIRIDGNFIDLTLNIQQKVLLGALSVGITLVISICLVKFFGMGIVGVLIGSVTGRFVLSIGYPSIVGKILGISLWDQLRRIGRPLLISVILLLFAYILDSLKWVNLPDSIIGWILFFLFAGITAAALLLLAFYMGLRRQQRAQLLRRVRMVIPHTSELGIGNQK